MGCLASICMLTLAILLGNIESRPNQFLDFNAQFESPWNMHLYSDSSSEEQDFQMSIQRFLTMTGRAQPHRPIVRQHKMRSCYNPVTKKSKKIGKMGFNQCEIVCKKRGELCKVKKPKQGSSRNDFLVGRAGGNVLYPSAFRWYHGGHVPLYDIYSVEEDEPSMEYFLQQPLYDSLLTGRARVRTNKARKNWRCGRTLEPFKSKETCEPRCHYPNRCWQRA